MAAERTTSTSPDLLARFRGRLSLPLIERSFTPTGVFLGAFALKILFTAVTLGTGFKGGEVTPLFCIGATLGYTFASLTGQPTAMFAALGFVAVGRSRAINIGRKRNVAESVGDGRDQLVSRGGKAHHGTTVGVTSDDFAAEGAARV